ncbi:MAG: MarR family transcriptional regulator [Clostridia bacterium]|nr:MarR family transcriptional regulator [Clostridia bacterium]
MKREKTIGFQIRTLNNLIKRDFEKSKNEIFGCSAGVHGWAIGYFYENSKKDVFQKDFEAHFSIRRSTATKMLQLMEKKGLIKRVSVENDLRLKKIVLTDKAIEVHKKITADIKHREKRLSKGISDTELDIFFKVATKIRNNLEENDD